MLTYFVYIVLIAALLTAFIFVYDIICYILIKSKLKGTASKLTDDDAKRIANESGGANLWLRIIIARYKHKMKSKTSGEAKTLKKFAKSTNKVNFAVSAIMVLSSVMLTAYGAGLYQLDYVLSHITTLFHDEDCTCYAKCTRNPEDDMKCSYELIFGNAEYEKLLYGMNLTPMEKELFLTFSDGKAQGEFIIKHLNDDMIETYKAALKTKGVKRLNSKSKLYSEMTDDELHDDLAKLLADYKKNGVNPNCTSCKDSNSFEVALGCQGLEHWKPGWTWQEIGDNDGTGPGGSTNLPGVSTMGNATGQYAVQLDDGMYYWYHQDGDHGCKCVHCGNWSAAQWAGPGKVKHAFGKDGCAVYSLAIGISNLYGAEITPAVIFEDLGSPITNGEITTVPMYFGGDNGRSIYYNAVANRLAQKYNLEVSSIWTSEVPKNIIKFIDDTLAKGGIVWGSWVNSQCQWCGSNNNKTHFMCIRKTDGTNYYCFTSCGGKCTSKGGKDGAIETMNYPIPKATCVNGFVGGKPIFGFVNPNATSGSSGGVLPDSEVFNKLKAAGFSDSDAKRVAIIYSAIKPVHGSQAALALAACSLCEGQAGQFEALTGYMTGKNSTNNLDKSYKGLYDLYHLSSKTQEQQECIDTFKNLGGKIISSASQAQQWQKACNTLESFCGSSKGQGIGFIQFSGVRRTPRLNAYAKATDFSEGGRWGSEMKACLDEISGNSTYKTTFKNAEAASNYTEAVTIMYKGYISGGSVSGLNLRQEKMRLISNALGGTKFS